MWWLMKIHLSTVNRRNAFTMMYKEYFKTYANVNNLGASLWFYAPKTHWQKN